MSALDRLIDRIVASPSVVVVGTGTGVGKTMMTGWLLGELAARDIIATSIKWVQTGTKSDPLDTMIHDHIATKVERGYSPVMSPKHRTVYSLPLAASPHLAAELAGVVIDANRCWRLTLEVSEMGCPVLVEGAGGVLVPMDRKTTLLQWIAMWDLPVIVVANDQLGTLNATALTLEAIERRRIEILGVIASPSSVGDDVITLDNRKMMADMAQRVGAEWVVGRRF